MNGSNHESWRERLETLLAASRMNELTPTERAELNDILRAHEDARQEASRWLLDEAALAECLRRSQIESLVREEAQSLVPAHEPGARRGWPRRWVSLAAAACFVVVAALVSVFMLTSASASPAAILRHALKVHSAALDRCYRVGGNFDSSQRVQAGLPAAGPRETLLWTRGDRFWNEARAGGQTVAWGRDEQGRAWFALSPEAGAFFDADEVPERFAQISELRSLQVESLLRSLLADFDLRREPDAAGGPVVHAELKPGHEHPRYRAALLVIDGSSGVLRQVDVQLVRPGRSPLPVSFTLVETGFQDDASYTLAGHLSEQAVIYDRHSAPGKRRTALAEFVRLLRGRPSRP
jgi:hypothetical protein